MLKPLWICAENYLAYWNLIQKLTSIRSKYPRCCRTLTSVKEKTFVAFDKNLQHQKIVYFDQHVLWHAFFIAVICHLKWLESSALNNSGTCVTIHWQTFTVYIILTKKQTKGTLPEGSVWCCKLDLLSGHM